MFSKLAPRSFNKLLTSRSAIISAHTVQKRHVKIVNKLNPTKDIVYLENVLSTEGLIADVTTLFHKMPEGVLDYNYKSKFPDTPFEKYNQEFEEEMKRPFFFSEDLIELGEELMGFSKKELIDGASQDAPKFFKEDNTFDPIVFADFFSGITKNNDDLVNRLIKRMTEGSSISRLMKDPPKVEDQERATKYLSEETIEEMNALLEVAKATVPKIDVDAVVSNLEQKFDSILEQYKDLLIENFEDVKKNNKELEFLSIFLDTDADGLPKIDMHSFEFMEKYFPEEVEAVIEEIELGNWDTEYLEEARVLKTGPDALFTKNKDWISKEYNKVDDDLQNELAISASITEEQKKFQILYQDVMSIARYNKELETEIGQLKFLLGGEDQEAAEKKKRAEEAAEEEDDAQIDKVLHEIMQTRSPPPIGGPEHVQNEAAKAAITKQIRNLMAGYDADYEGPVERLSISR